MFTASAALSMPGWTARAQDWQVAAGTRPARPMVYMAESVPLAVLENPVPISRTDFRKPGGSLGADHWRSLARKLAFCRPDSALVRRLHGSSNYLLNPIHPDFRQIVAHWPIEFQFDPRLFGLANQG
jgi:hypothetical protein